MRTAPCCLPILRAPPFSSQSIDRRERLRRLALETIDLAKDPYYMRNHLGQIECRLCLTIHPNEGNYLAHTQVRTLSWSRGLVGEWAGLAAWTDLSSLPCGNTPMHACMLPTDRAGEAASAEPGQACGQGGGREANGSGTAEARLGKKDRCGRPGLGPAERGEALLRPGQSR